MPKRFKPLQNALILLPLFLILFVMIAGKGKLEVVIGLLIVHMALVMLWGFSVKEKKVVSSRAFAACDMWSVAQSDFFLVAFSGDAQEVLRCTANLMAAYKMLQRYDPEHPAIKDEEYVAFILAPAIIASYCIHDVENSQATCCYKCVHCGHRFETTAREFHDLICNEDFRIKVPDRFVERARTIRDEGRMYEHYIKPTIEERLQAKERLAMKSISVELDVSGKPLSKYLEHQIRKEYAMQGLTALYFEPHSRRTYAKFE